MNFSDRTTPPVSLSALWFVCRECGDETTETHDDLCPSCWYVEHGGDLGMRYCWPPFKIARADGANVYVSFGAPA